jgi:acetate kinase
MGTRCGQLDPGVVLYLLRQNGMSPDEIADLLYKRSGLLGLSELSGDMRTLLSSDSPKAAEAIDYYVFRARREIGAMTAVLGGLDALVFCGGVGENAPEIRRRIIADLGYLGLVANPEKNQANALDIGNGPTRLMVIPTDEERVMARAVQAHL